MKKEMFFILMMTLLIITMTTGVFATGSESVQKDADICCISEEGFDFSELIRTSRVYAEEYVFGTSDALDRFFYNGAKYVDIYESIFEPFNFFCNGFPGCNFGDEELFRIAVRHNPPCGYFTCYMRDTWRRICTRCGRYTTRYFIGTVRSCWFFDMHPSF